jgi:hypothetical protein
MLIDIQHENTERVKYYYDKADFAGMKQELSTILTSCFGLMTDSAVVDSALVDAALRKSGLISNGKE